MREHERRKKDACIQTCATIEPDDNETLAATPTTDVDGDDDSVVVVVVVVVVELLLIDVAVEK